MERKICPFLVIARIDSRKKDTIRPECQAYEQIYCGDNPSYLISVDGLCVEEDCAIYNKNLKRCGLIGR